MIAIASLLLIVLMSLLITRTASVLLEHTGLSRDAARFQARSAFTGSGFTTSEAELVVGHPVRRRIVMWLMLVGNVGIVSSVAAVLISAIDLRSSDGVIPLLALLLSGLAALGLVATNRRIDAAMCAAIQWAIRRWSRIEAEDYAQLLRLHGEYAVARIRIEDDQHWFAGRALADANVTSEGVLVLGIECPGGNFIGAPSPDVECRVGDTLLLYGQATAVDDLGGRLDEGQAADAHARRVQEHGRRLEYERARADR